MKVLTTKSQIKIVFKNLLLIPNTKVYDECQTQGKSSRAFKNNQKFQKMEDNLKGRGPPGKMTLNSLKLAKVA